MEEKYKLITNNLQEILGVENLKEILKERNLKVYWGTATTGKPHIAYFLPICKIGEMLKAGCEVTILFADLHGFLDNMKAPWPLIHLRADYYEALIRVMLTTLGIDLSKLKFVKGTEFQLKSDYTIDMYRLSSIVTEHQAKRAGAEVVKQTENAPLSGLLYPGLQALDEEYLKVDAQFGGVDQRKIFIYAEKFLPLLGYKKRIHLMTPMIPGLNGNKMSASEANSKIDLLDDEKTIKMKLKKAFCEMGKVENNGILAFLKFVLFPILINDKKKPFVIERTKENGGDIEYDNYENLEKDFIQHKLHPGDLKKTFGEYLFKYLLSPIQQHFREHPEIEEIAEKAYSKDLPNLKDMSLNDEEDNPLNDYFNVEQLKLLNSMEFRVGEVRDIHTHPNSDKLLKLEVNFGDEDDLSVIASGLINDLEIGDKSVFLMNVKPAKLIGEISSAVMLCGYSDDKVGILNIDKDCSIGDDVSIFVSNNSTTTTTISTITTSIMRSGKKDQLKPRHKLWEKFHRNLKISDEGNLIWYNQHMTTRSGKKVSSKLIGAPVR
ncbi:hypothetical protein SNEBB_008215 [Seison nebaliae]|nr:hypothetical protein SNEBB_008215 [Seison nebaliae]